MPEKPFDHSVTARFLRLAVVALLLAASATVAKGQELRFVYCFVTVPATRVIFASPTLTVGPPAERASYGPAFAEHLAGQKRVPPDAEALCIMRSSESQVAQSRQALSSFCPINVDGTNSPLCGTRWTVTDVAWSGTGGARPVGAGGAPTVVADGAQGSSPEMEGGSQRQPAKPAYITYQNGNRGVDGWEAANVTVSTAILNCGGTLTVAAQLLPSSFTTSIGYWYRGARYSVSPLVPKTPPRSVRYASYLFTWSDLPSSVPGPRGAFGHFDVDVPAGTAPDCTGFHVDVARFATLLQPAPTPRNIALFVEHLTIHPAATQPPPLRDAVVERWIQSETARTGGNGTRNDAGPRGRRGT